jgi:hypothetical protein
VDTPGRSPDPGATGVAAVVADDGRTVKIVSQNGPGYCARHEIAVMRDQAARRPAPMRYRLPYGCWRCGDGREILFNREYRPIWERRPGQRTRRADLDEWVEDIVLTRHFFTDHSPPWISPATARRCEAVLRAYGAPEPELIDGSEFIASCHGILMPPGSRRG